MEKQNSSIEMAVKKICFSQVIAILQALKGKYNLLFWKLLCDPPPPDEPMTPNRIAKLLNEDGCQVKHVLESAAENGILVKVGRKFDWSYKMKYPKRRCHLPRIEKRIKRKIIRKHCSL